MICSTTNRVVKHTTECVNRQIREMTEKNVRCAAAGGREAIDERIAELDREWDIERALEANAAVASILGVVFGVTRSPLWFAFPAVVGGFLLQHAIQGWYPPVPLLRRLGFQTQSEIEKERYAKTVRRLRNIQAGKGVAGAAEVIAAVDR